MSQCSFCAKRKAHQQRFGIQRSGGGFSTLELIIATGLLAVVVGTVATLLHNLQQGRVAELDVSEIQQNQRYAMDVILRHVRGAGNDPNGINVVKFDMDPLGNGQYNAVRIRSDFNPPDGDTSDPLENVLFSWNNNVVTMQDSATGTTTEVAQNISGVTYEFFDASGNATSSSADAVRVRVTLAGVSSHRDPRNGQFRTFSLIDEAWVRKF